MITACIKGRVLLRTNRFATVGTLFPRLAIVLALVACARAGVTVGASPRPAVFGAPVTLTATITPATATGKVTFYDGAVVLGTSIVSGGTATLTVSFNVTGPRALAVRYLGDQNHAAAISPVFTESVNSVPAYGFIPTNVNLGISIADFAVADFNGDGKADVVIAPFGNFIAATLGNGDGTFAAPILTANLAGQFDSVAAADFDGDGKVDIAAGNRTLNNISVFLGHGDGTFGSASSYSTADGPMVVADFNLDGIPDLAVVHAATQTIAILLGKGDGSFGNPIEYGAGGLLSTVAVGDVNGDGKPDLVTIVPTADTKGSLIIVLLGKGDGSLSPPRSYVLYPTLPFEEFDQGIILEDFNGDGKLDLAIAPAFTYGAWVCFGNGDGTFAPPSQFNAAGQDEGYGVGIAAVDVNGDQKMDIVMDAELHMFLGAGLGNELQTFYGNGDGTFQPVEILLPPLTHILNKLVPADFNGDGRVDLLTWGFDWSSNSILKLFTGSVIPELRVSTTHVGTFVPGQTGATFTVTVSNVPGASPSTGTVTVNYGLNGLMNLDSMTGAGWTCSITPATCSRVDSLAPGSSYPPITVTAHVSPTVSSSMIVENLAIVSGGGSETGEAFDFLDIVVQMLGCSFSISSSGVSLGADAISKTVGVTATAGCAWTVNGQTSWLTITSGSSGYGDGTVVFLVGANPGPSRQGILTIAGQTFTVSQSSLANTAIPGSVGVFRNGQWWIDGDGDFAWTGTPDRVFYFGQSGDIPIMGDWDNTGVRRVGVFRNGQWWLDLNNDGLWDATHDTVFNFGQAGDVPVFGDWDGTGVQRIGVFRNGQWWVDINNDHLWDAVHDSVFVFGQTGDIPVMGDWDNTARQRIGIFRSGQWWLDLNGDHIWDVAHDTGFIYGQAGDVPVVGDWTHTGQTRIGVFRQGQWWLDLNGDRIWDVAHDLVTYFGIATDRPVVAQ